MDIMNKNKNNLLSITSKTIFTFIFLQSTIILSSEESIDYCTTTPMLEMGIRWHKDPNTNMPGALIEVRKQIEELDGSIKSLHLELENYALKKSLTDLEQRHEKLQITVEDLKFLMYQEFKILLYLYSTKKELHNLKIYTQEELQKNTEFITKFSDFTDKFSGISVHQKSRK